MDQRIVLPVHIETQEPDDRIWERLISAGDVVSLAVIDDWGRLAKVKPRLRASGLQIFGLVSTHKSTIEREVCHSVIDEWFRIHPDLDGIFVGEGPPLDSQHPERQEPDWIWKYFGDDDGQGLYRYIKRQKVGAQVFLDCPGCQDERVLDVCDIAQVVNVDYAHYIVNAWWGLKSQSWWENPPANKRIAHIIHSCPAEGDWSMHVAVGLSKARSAHLVHVSDGDLVAHDTFPPYWDAEVRAVAGTPDDPCQVIGEAVTEISHVIDDLATMIDDAPDAEKAQRWRELARLGAERAEIGVVFDECRTR